MDRGAGAIDGRRPSVTAQQAANVLGRDVRTVRRMIESGELAGYVRFVEKQRRWYVYVDQLHESTEGLATPQGDDPRGLLAEVQALRQANSELRAELASERETSRVLLASQSLLRDALERYRDAAEEVNAGAQSSQSAAEHFLNGANGFRRAADQLNAALGEYGDALALKQIPDFPPET